MKNTLIILIGITLLVSCQKGVITDCKFTSGKLKTEFRYLEDFNNLLLNDNVNVILQKSDSSGVRVETGENLIQGIKTTVNDQGLLEISNDNTCDWARDYDNLLNVYVYYNKIDSISYRSIGNITNIDTLRADSLNIDVFEGAGDIDLDINVDKLFCAIHNGTADINLAGFAGVSYVYSASFGLIDNSNLSCSHIYANNRSSNNIFLNANNTLEVIIENIGDIYYRGDPVNIQLNKLGSGNLIKMN
ncbi:MAG: hypothetical protein HN336_04600 [Lentimicrobiaceae bacterium]|nr:hypothetical protein [Lentimicrobiaceae bacterium]MBT3455016.1 hypothetical protein [Lentimicrobiaceae bacterium]MBT3818659.1 hypothetical protein [Lentimicrobiaceae bacterium]MBT4060390.1 hypothetical protein [Lentimicrobiaceae bacterium]MBT4191604.1 hypothetical protein [Lentimicrobiaceae bacterium]